MEIPQLIFTKLTGTDKAIVREIIEGECKSIVWVEGSVFEINTGNWDTVLQAQTLKLHNNFQQHVFYDLYQGIFLCHNAPECTEQLWTVPENVPQWPYTGIRTKRQSSQSPASVLILTMSMHACPIYAYQYLPMLQEIQQYSNLGILAIGTVYVQYTNGSGIPEALMEVESQKH